MICVYWGGEISLCKHIYANTFRSALLSVMKMLKLLLLSCAYAVIVKVVQDMKVGTVTEERHHSAQQLQSTLEHIILVTEQKLKNASTQLAKQHFDKVTTLHFDDPYPNEYCDMYVLKMDDGAFALSAILVLILFCSCYLPSLIFLWSSRSSCSAGPLHVETYHWHKMLLLFTNTS